MTSNEDFLFAQEAVAAGFVSDAHVAEALELQRRMAEDLRLDERLSVLMVKRGWIAEDQARRIYAKLAPEQGGGPGQIHGYRLLEVLGRGAMGTVYRALHLGLNREVAVKILRPDLAGDRTQVERLKAEAAMLASLDHPNIVRALDAGESNGFPYVVMELVEGETLRDRLRREGRLDEDEALRITRGLADALERARRMGVVHRDVKPGNILMSRTGQPKLMDLGLAKGPIDLGLTQHGATVGTPQYISPEQALDPRKADTRSDIYSLGATLYAMLTGRPPFDGATLAEILTKVLYEAPVPVRTLRPEVSAETGYLVERMMLRDPSLRYRTPALVVADVERLQQGASILPQGFSGNWEAFLLRKQVRRGAVLVGAGVLAGLLTALGVRLWSDHRDAREDRRRVEAEVEAVRARLLPLETAADVRTRLADIERLLAAARRVGSPLVDALEVEARNLRAERDRGARLERLLGDVVDPAVREGRFTEAHRALARFFEENESGPARREADRRRTEVAAASDRALEVRVREDLPFRPAGPDELVAALEGWSGALVARHVRTPAFDEVAARAEAALRAARRVAGAVRDALAEVTPAAVAEAVAARRFADAARALAQARAAAKAAVDDDLAPLATGDPRFVVAAPWAQAVVAPLTARRAALDDAVAAAAVAVRDDAWTRWTDGDVVGALDLLDVFAAAAAGGGDEAAAWPEVAQEARALKADLEAKAAATRGEAQRALDALAAEVARALHAGDLAAVDRAVAAARADGERFRPVLAGLEDLETVAPALRRLRADAVEALRRRAATRRDESTWLPTLHFRGDARPARRVEVVAVDEAEGVLEYATHEGGGHQAKTKRPLADLTDDDVLALANRDPRAPDTAAVLAWNTVARYDRDDPDLYAPLRLLDDVRRRLRAAGREGRSPLDAWAAAEAARRSAWADENEYAARLRLEQGRQAMARSEFATADWHFRGLLDPAAEPKLVLPRTKVVADNEGYVRAQLQWIEQQSKVSLLDRLWPSARFHRDPVAPPDSLFVEAEFGFDDAAPLKASFLGGWARRELAPSEPERVLTPGGEPNRALRLNPGGGTERVWDRPLVLECPFDPAKPGAPLSVSFRYWAEGPVCLAVHLNGVQVAILSDDPADAPFPPDVPRLPDEAAPPKADVYGRGRGILFRAGPELGDPARWPWPDLHQGRHLVPPAVNGPSIRGQLRQRLFGFRPQERPYRVRFTWDAERGVELAVDDEVRATDRSDALRLAPPTGRIELLTFTSGVIDDLKVAGRVSEAWLAARKAREKAATGSATK